MGGTFYAVMGGCRILDASKVDQGVADDDDVTSWDTANDFILAANINSGGKDTVPAQYKLRWQESGGSYVDLDSTGEMKFGATDLVNGTDITEGNRKCDSQGGDTWQAGEEVEGTKLSTSIDLVDEYESEVHFSISPADAQGGVLYEFELYDATQPASKGTCGSTLTTAAGAATSYQAVGGGSMAIAGVLARILTAYKTVGGHAMTITGVLSKGKLSAQAVGAYAMTIAGTLTRVFTAGQAVGGHSMVITGTLGRVATFYRAVGGHAMTIVQALSKKGFKDTGGHAMVIAGVGAGVKVAVQAVGGYAMTIAGSLVKKGFKDTGGHSMVITGTLTRVATFYKAVGGYAMTIAGALGTAFTPGGAPTLERAKQWLLKKVSN